MYGETSEFGPIDLLAGLAVNIGGTHMACKNPTLRVGIKNKAGDVPAYGDFRFIGGVLGALAGQYVENPMVRRASHDAAAGLLHSFVATETARRAAVQNIEAGRGPVAQVTDQSSAPAPEAAPAEAGKAGGGNYAYGW